MSGDNPDGATLGSFGERFRARAGSLSPSASRVAKFINQNRATTLGSSAAELAASIGTSDATVVRAVQALGFEGLSDLRQSLAAGFEQRSTPADNMRRTLADVGESAERAVNLVLETHRQSIDALQSPEIRAKITEAISTLHQAERIIVFGIGPSAPLARYVAILLARNGRRARTLDATGISLADQLLDLREHDALLILAYGRSYREVVATFAEARRLRLPVVLVTDTLEKKLARRADVVIPAKRGSAGRTALHGATLVVLESLVLGLAASDREGALATLDRLDDLREAVNGKRADVR
jgi:DNA-binding MurR/RpiR family transcriptional regulator